MPTLHYRGRLNPSTSLESLEDRVLDLALALGGKVQIMRIGDDSGRRCRVRGVIWDVAPGCDSFALLFSPEGRLIPLDGIDDDVPDPSAWVSIRTGHATPKAHMTIVHILEAIREHHVPDLEVRDEGGTWGSQDLRGQRHRRGLEGEEQDSFAETIETGRRGPFDEEDAGILTPTLEEIAENVRKAFHGPCEHKPVTFAGDENPWDDSPGTEAEWDAMYIEQRRKQEQMHRRIEEGLARGEDPMEAFDRALEANGVGLEEVVPEGEQDEEEERTRFTPPPLFDPQGEEPQAWSPEPVPSLDPLEDRDHPFLGKAMELFKVTNHLLHRRKTKLSDPLHTLESALLDVNGGLAQAVGFFGQEGGLSSTGLNLVQLKRALRGTAFALGALRRARIEGGISKDTHDRFLADLDMLKHGIRAEIDKARSWL